MAQNNNDSDQQTEIAVRQLQPPHTQAGSQTHRHITFSYQEKNKTFFFFLGRVLGNSLAETESLGVWKGRIRT